MKEKFGRIKWEVVITIVVSLSSVFVAILESKKFYYKKITLPYGFMVSLSYHT